LSQDRDTRTPGENESPRVSNREAARLTAGRISAAVGLLFAVGGFVGALMGGGASITAGALGVVLGILSYFLGSRRLGLLAVVLCVVALFFGLAASQGYIPGIEPSDRGLPPAEPRAGDN
jgi:VIT1/CCC1 family predicted Fe2+/Mn2+ transporter